MDKFSNLTLFQNTLFLLFSLNLKKGMGEPKESEVNAVSSSIIIPNPNGDLVSLLWYRMVK